MADRTDAALAAHARPVLVHPSALPVGRGAFACFSSIERRGRWSLPRLFRALSVMGNVELDLTQVELGAVTDIEVRCFMGNVEIKVSPDVRLECDGDAVIGNFEVHRNVASTLSPDAPLVRIKAGVLLGNIEVTVVDPDPRSFFHRVKARWKLRDRNPD